MPVSGMTRLSCQSRGGGCLPDAPLRGLRRKRAQDPTTFKRGEIRAACPEARVVGEADARGVGVYFGEVRAEDGCEGADGDFAAGGTIEECHGALIRGVARRVPDTIGR